MQNVNNEICNVIILYCCRIFGNNGFYNDENTILVCKSSGFFCFTILEY